MITHCNETISGLDTIRAFGKETWFMSEMINRIDNHTKVFLIISSSNRWLGIALVSTFIQSLKLYAGLIYIIIIYSMISGFK